MKQKMLPMNLQLFAEGDGDDPQNQLGGDESGGANKPQGQEQGFDYDKLAKIISGKQQVDEKNILRNYFKQQGLSKEEADAAIAEFKKQKLENEPDVDAMQLQITQAQQAAQDAIIKKEGALLGITLGLDAKSIPYVLKMADTSQVIGEDGTVNQETLKQAINQVLEDVPALKPNKDDGQGFQQMIGSSGDDSGEGNQNNVISSIFGNTK